MYKYLTGLIIAVAALGAAAQPAPQRVEGRRHYNVFVNQTNDTVTLNRSLNGMRGNRSKLAGRGILTDLIGGYMSLGTSSLLSATQNLIGMGVGYIKEAVRDKRPDWEKATLEECTFVKTLPMRTEILDFYAEPSALGALDPTNMKFSGFGCRQYITLTDSAGVPREEEVFYVSCRLRADDHGIARMLNHSKFEIEVDELRFNPWLCNLPNDSVAPDPDTRIPFSFENRKDLKFNVLATIKSSWINEAIQVMRDVTLGEFLITADIAPEQLDADGVFRYSIDNPADTVKVVGVTGDSFLVPRSFVGSADMSTPQESWGTGQYKVEMRIAQTCRINEAYYTRGDGAHRKWDKAKWGPEWKLQSRRRPRAGFWQQFKQTVIPTFSDDKWVTTIIEPFTTTLMKHGTQLVNAGASKLMPAQGAAKASAKPTQSGAKPATPTQSGAAPAMP